MTEHTKDSDCTVDPETGLCIECGVCHTLGDCPECGGKGYHVDGCSEMDESVFESIVCIGCLENARYAGTLESATHIEGDRPQEACGQCNGLLIDGEVYKVAIRP